MRVLVTGGAGYVGSELTTMLLSMGHKVTVVDIMWYRNNLDKHPNLAVIKDSVNEFTTTAHYDVVYHLAAVSNDPSVEDFPKLTWETNVLGTQQLLNRVKCDTFVLASSGSIYGVSRELRVTETTPLVPMSDYNKSKMVAERVAWSYKNKARIVAFRPGTVCGLSKRMRLDVAGNAFAKSAALGKLRVHGGEQIRPVLPMRDMVSAYIYVLKNEKLSGCFNVGDTCMSINKIAKMAQELNPNAALLVDEANLDPRSYRLNSDKLKTTGFGYYGSISNSMLDVYNWARTRGDLEDDIYYNARWMRKIHG